MANGAASSASAREPRFLFKVAGKELKVLGFTATERISTAFDVRLTLVSEDEVKFDEVMGKEAVLTILVEDSERFFHGIINQFSQAGRSGDHRLYRARLVPSLWLLSLEQDCRIFQDMYVLEIVKQILEEGGLTSEWFSFRLQGQYQPKTYCVQYREADLHFISRLLEEEGIFYFFEHTKDKHLLIFGDSTVNYQPITGEALVTFSDAESMVPTEEFVKAFTMSQRIHTGKITLRDFNFEKPALDLTSQDENKSYKHLEAYDFPAEYYEQDSGKKMAQMRLQEAVMFRETADGESNCCRFVPGFTFKLTGHELTGLNQEYLLVQIMHRGTQPQVLRDRAGQGGTVYSNEVMVIPSLVSFRPERQTPKPVIEGIQTAKVVGLSGEEIYTDEYGRVKVQFHWDREGEYNEKSSCWIRVSHSWAGGQYGYFSLPRVGQEVIVSFVEGDPDRPLITGRAYNADHLPPYPLPDDKTKSTIKSKSYKGEGANEIRFEDDAGKEQLYIHAQKDLDIRVLNDRKTTVDNTQHLIVTGESNTKVGSLSVTVEGDEAIKVGGQRSLTVEKDILKDFKKSHKAEVGKEHYLKAGTNIIIESGSELTLKSAGGFLKIDSSGITIEGTKVMINSGGAEGTPIITASPALPAAPVETATTVSGADVVYTAVVARAAVPAAEAAPVEEHEEADHWIEIELTDEAGEPFSNEEYTLLLPDGQELTGRLDENGFVRVEGIEPGTCNVTFPNFDRDA